MDDQAKILHIKTELAKLPDAIFESNQVKILCRFHDDHNPSLDVSLVPISKVKNGETIIYPPGTFNCWSCRASGGWNKLANKLGLESWGREEAEKSAETPQNKFNLLSQEIEQIKQAIPTEYVKPRTEGPWQGTWRGLTGSFLRSIGAEKLWDRKDEAYRIFLPYLNVQNRLIGHIGARPDNSPIPDKRKYINSVDLPSQDNWYCLNFEKEPKCVVICEGPFDLLRLRAQGIPAIGALGTNQISDIKIMALMSKGCHRVVLALDADPAGDLATKLFHGELNKWGFEVVDLGLKAYRKNPADDKEKIDPGNCPQEALDNLKRYLNQGV
jgi:5S rRNA maturation endonuclease (ribonuclease M5)